MEVKLKPMQLLKQMSRNRKLLKQMNRTRKILEQMNQQTMKLLKQINIT